MKTILSAALIFISGLALSLSSSADNILVPKATTLASMQNLGITPKSTPQLISQQVTSLGSSDMLTVQLAFPNMPSIRIFLKGPRGFYLKADSSLRSLFLAAGFFTGANSALLLGDIENTVVIGFDYPYSIAEIGRDPGNLLQTFRVTPGQMALVIKWISQQTWAQPQQILAMGVSLGGLFLPAALHMTQEMNVSVLNTVFAFTGANVKTILANNLKDQLDPFLVDVLLFTVPTLNTLNDPQLYLPFLNGSFLVIHSDGDQVIPRETTESLWNSLPEPKSRVLLHGKHINVDQSELIEQTKNAILNWLPKN